MANLEDIDELARRFLDLWQEQAQNFWQSSEFQRSAAPENGPEPSRTSATGVRDGLAKFLEDSGFTSETAASAAQLWSDWFSWQAGSPRDMGGEQDRYDRSSEGRSDRDARAPESSAQETSARDTSARDTSIRGFAAGTASASASPGDGQHDLDELLCRIHALEERIAALEAGEERE